MKTLYTIAILIGAMSIVLSSSYIISKRTSNQEVISPRENVECVVVSRMFNTSVDCWKVDK